MLTYEEYVERFAGLRAEMVTTKEQYLAEAEKLNRQSFKVKFKIIPACCNVPYDVTWNDFKTNKNNKCSRCNYKAMGQEKRETYQSVKERFESYGVTLITTEDEYNAHPELGLSRYMFKINAKCDHLRDTKFHNFEKDAGTHGVCISCSARMKNRYETVHVPYLDIKKLFEDAKCELITTEQEYIDNKLNICREFEYKGACGHVTKEILLDIEFKKSVICKPCRDEKANRVRNERVNENGRLNNLIVEEEAANWIKELIEAKFEVAMTKEGCKTDMAMKPKDIDEDAWVRVQLKAAGKMNDESNYSCGFNLGNGDYTGMIMIFTAKVVNTIWIIDYEEIKDRTTMTISRQASSKFADNKVPPRFLATKLYDMYFDDKFPKSTLSSMLNREFASGKKEDKYISLRKEKITFLNFEDAPNYSVVDFKVNGLKVQEKIATKDHNQYIVCLHKSRGKNKKVPYDKGDNDVYWFHLDDWRLFYVIPESVLIEKGHITDGDKVGNAYISIYPKLYNDVPKKNAWIEGINCYDD